MRCSTAKRLISDLVDGELDLGSKVPLDGHLQACAECQKFYNDVQQIVKGSRLLKKLSPAEGNWLRIQAQIQAEKRSARMSAPAYKKPKRRSFLIPSFWPQYALIAAVLLAFIVGGTVTGVRHLRRGDLFGRTDPQQYALSKLKEAEHHYQLAIRALWEAVSNQETEIDPQVLVIFQKNLEIIDLSISSCREAVLQDPGNIEMQNYLLAAYRGKMSLLDRMLALEDVSPQGRESAKIL